MTAMDDKARAFSERLTRIQQRHHNLVGQEIQAMSGQTVGSTPPDFSHLPGIDARMAAYNAWLDHRVRLWRGELAAPLEVGQTSSALLPAQPERTPQKALVAADYKALRASGVKILAEVDHAMFKNFELGRFPRSLAFNRPPRLYHRLPDFLSNAARGLNLSPQETRNLLKNPSAAARQVPAIYLPGLGCLVNGSSFSGLQQESLGEEEDFEARLDVLACVTKEKWGWGFISEYTTLGKAMLENGLLDTRARQMLGLQPDPDAYARLMALERGMGIAVAGWQDWLWDYLSNKQIQPLGARNQAGLPGLRIIAEFLVKLAKVLPLDIGRFALSLVDVWDLVAFLFMQVKTTPEAMNVVLLWLEQAAARPDLHLLGMDGSRLRSLIGWNFFSLLEASVSSYCVPYGMIIIFHVDAGLASAAPQAIERAFSADLRQNPNTRLAMLSWLNAAIRYDPHALRLAARNELKLDSPEAYLR